MCLGLYWVWLYLQTPVCHDIRKKVLHQSPSLHCPWSSINQMVINRDSPQQSWSNPNIDVFYIPSILSHPLWKLKLICVLFFPNIIACHRPEPLILYLFPEMMLDLLNISNIFSSILDFQHIFFFDCHSIPFDPGEVRRGLCLYLPVHSCIGHYLFFFCQRGSTAQFTPAKINHCAISSYKAWDKQIHFPG